MAQGYEYGWQSLLQEVRGETYPLEFELKLAKVQAVIYERVRVLSSIRDHHEEREALTKALKVLRKLKKDRLAMDG